MPPANSFKSNSLGEDFIEEFQDDCYGWLRNNICYSKSSYFHDISHQILVQSNIPFGERFCLKIFKMADIFDIRMEWI